jgi:L-cystine uptake protein TcyP (sodium:dicarboxylate symporter family)
VGFNVNDLIPALKKGELEVELMPKPDPILVVVQPRVAGIPGSHANSHNSGTVNVYESGHAAKNPAESKNDTIKPTVPQPNVDEKYFVVIMGAIVITLLGVSVVGYCLCCSK